MFWTTTAYAMGSAGAPAAGGEAAMWGNFIPIIAMLAIFYFLLIRPQQKRAKEHKNMISALKRGDEVVTAGGIYGRVTDTGDDYVMLDLGKTEIKVARGSITVVRGSEKAIEKKSKKDEADSK